MRHDGLTERQMQVAQLVAIGFLDKQIAQQLGVEEQTVRFHVSRIAEEWGIDGEQRNIRVQITRRVLKSAA